MIDIRAEHLESDAITVVGRVMVRCRALADALVTVRFYGSEHLRAANTITVQRPGYGDVESFRRRKRCWRAYRKRRFLRRISFRKRNTLSQWLAQTEVEEQEVHDELMEAVDELVVRHGNRRHLQRSSPEMAALESVISEAAMRLVVTVDRAEHLRELLAAREGKGEGATGCDR